MASAAASLADFASPHKVSLACLVRLYVKDNKSIFQNDRKAYHDFHLLLVRGVKGVGEFRGVMEPSLLSLRRMLLDHSHSSEIAAHLMKTLASIKSPDDLFDLIRSFERLMETPDAASIPQNVDTLGRPTHIDRGSIFGIFLRRLLVSCNATFESLSQLYHAISAYTRQDEHESKSAPVSKCELQGLLHQKALEVEMGGFISSTLKRAADEKKCKDDGDSNAFLLSACPHLPRSHFLRYLSDMRSGEFQGSVDSLHAYFDHRLVVRRGNRSPHVEKDHSSSKGGRHALTQFAVLNLAGLHCHFGHETEAFHAIQEAVRVSQQAGDHVCVAFALSWLLRLSDDSNRRGRFLRRCIGKGVSNGLFQLEGLTFLAAAKHELLAMPRNGRSHFEKESSASKPADVRRMLRMAIDVTSQSLATLKHNAHQKHSSAESSQRLQKRHYSDPLAKGRNGARDRAAVPISPTISLKRVLRIYSKAHLLQASAWRLYGSAPLASFELDDDQTAQDRNDRALAACQLCEMLSHGFTGQLLPPQAATAAATGNPADSAAERPLTPSSTASTYQKLNTLSLSSSNNNSPTGAAASFNFNSFNERFGILIPEELLKSGTSHADSAASLLGQQQDRFSFGTNALAAAQLVHRWAVSMRDWRLLRIASTRLQSLRKRKGGVEANALAEWSEGLIAQGNLSDAQALLSNVIASTQEAAPRMRAELMRSRVFLEARAHVPALPLALRAASASSLACYDSLRAHSLVQIAESVLAMGFPARADGVLQQILPHVVAHGTLELRGKAHLLRAKALTSQIASYAIDAESFVALEEGLQAALARLCTAKECFLRGALQSGQQESTYLLARVHDSIASVVKRAAGRYPAVAQSAEAKKRIAHHYAQRDRCAKEFLELRRASLVSAAR